MAYVVGDKTFRNLEEQVLKNKEDIARHYETDRVLADWGIKVLGVVNNVEELPSENNNFGDAYGVAGDPIDYYIWTRANANVGEENDYWLNVGALSLVGPRGPQGVQGVAGPVGQRGSKWYSGNGVPASGGGDYKDNDQYLNAANGDVYLYSSQHWVLQGNIRGPQGVQGPVGPKGEVGGVGPVGPQGPKGDTGASFQVVGILASTDLLPTPTAANRSKAYIIDGDMYIVIGDTNLSWYNAGVVEGVEGPQGPAGPAGPAGADIQVVTITGIPSDANSGTLSQEQVNTLLAHPSNYIQFFNENFYPQDVEISQGYIVYSHVGMYEGNMKIKTITLTINSRSWVLSEFGLSGSGPVLNVTSLPEATSTSPTLVRYSGVIYALIDTEE